MQIPEYPRYEIDEKGTVYNFAKKYFVKEYRDRSNYRAVNLKNNKTSSIGIKVRLDRLMLKVFKPYNGDSLYDDSFLSVGYLDGNKDNIAIENLKWNDTLYIPQNIPGVENCPLGTWFIIPGFDYLEITFKTNWIIRRVDDKRVLTQNWTWQGYITVGLMDGKRAGLHRLVALTFLKHPINADHLVVNHRDECKENNSVFNLEWVSNKDNVLHSVSIEKEEKPFRKILIKSTISGSELVCTTINAAAFVVDCTKTSMNNILKGNRKEGNYYRGFLVKYEDDQRSWSEIHQDVIKFVGDSDLTKFRKDFDFQGYKVASKNMISGKVTIYNSVYHALKYEQISLGKLYWYLTEENPRPYNEKCFRTFTGEEIKWPNYPPEIVKVFSETRLRPEKPIKVTYPDGTLEVSRSLVHWCKQDPINRPYGSIDSAVQEKGLWKSIRFDKIDLKDYV